MKFFAFWDQGLKCIAAVSDKGDVEFLSWQKDLEFHFDGDPQTTWDEMKQAKKVFQSQELTKDQAKEKMIIWQTALSGITLTLINGGK